MIISIQGAYYMARKQAAHILPSANLSYEQMKVANVKINRRINELKSFDVDSVQTGTEPSLLVLSQSLDQFLIDTFGNESAEYHRHGPYTELRTASLMVGHTPSSQIREWTQSKINNAIAMLVAIQKGFNEALEDAGMNGSSAKSIKAYEGLELHPQIAQVSSSLFLNGHCANAVEDAVKQLNAMVRSKSGLRDDGKKLMQQCFNVNNPILKINPLIDDSDKSEQEGFMHLFIGAVMALRNPRAHKIIEDDPELALESIALISFLAKQVDRSKTD